MTFIKEVSSTESEVGITSPAQQKCQRNHSQRVASESEGWLVAAVASLLHALLAGGVGMAGVLLVELVDYFRTGKAQVAWIGAIQLAVSGVSSLVLGGVVARFGCRTTAVLGAVLTSGGHVAAAYSNNIPTLCVTLGLFVGIGHSCLVMSCMVAVQTHYVRRRSLATSIMVMGISVGVMVWPPWTEYLFRVYNWRGALLINAAICLHGLPLALLLGHSTGGKPRVKQPVSVIKETEMQEISKERTSGSCTNNELVGIPLKISDMQSVELLETLTHDHAFDFVAMKNDVRYTVVLGEKEVAVSPICANNTRPEKPINVETEKDSSKACRRKSKQWTCTNNAYFEIMRKPEVMLYILSAGLINFGHILAVTYIPTHAVSLNISKDMAATLVSVLGLLGPVARVGSGFLGDFLSKHRLLMYSLSGICTGISSILAALTFNYACMVIYAISFAIFSGCYVCLLSTVMTDLVGIKRLPQALGILLPFVGVCLLTSVTTSGLLMDITQSTSVAFVYCGGIQALGGGVGLAAWGVLRRQRTVKLKHTDQRSIGLQTICDILCEKQSNGLEY